MILAIRAIWESCQNGTRLHFQSPHYTHTLMTPFFNPGPIEHPDVPIFIGGVNLHVPPGRGGGGWFTDAFAQQCHLYP